MIPELTTHEELLRIEAKAETLISTARGTVALNPDDTEVRKVLAFVEMLQELLDAHESIASRHHSIGATSPALYHDRLASFARRMRADRLLMLEYIL